MAAPGCGPKGGTTHSTDVSTIRFQEITSASGVRFGRSNGAFGEKWMPEIMGGGGGFIDYDNDGKPDIILINGDWWPGHPLTGVRPQLKLYHNDGGGRFSDVTSAMGLNISGQFMGVAVGDYDGDGFDDIFISGVADCRLLHNQAGRRFTDVTSASGLSRDGWGTSAAWLDYDGDGRLDLFVCHYLKWSPAANVPCGQDFRIYCRPQEYPGESCRLYRNLGGGKFRDVTKEAGLFNDHSKALGVAICDLDSDGRPDIIVANDMAPNFVYHNEGGRFTDISYASGMALDESGGVRSGMGIDTAYAGADGRLAVCIGNFFAQGVAYFETRSGSSFAEATKPAGLLIPTYPYVTFGLFFADFDNDGMGDLFLTNGHIYDNVRRMDPAESFEQPCQVFRNVNGRYQDISGSAGKEVADPIPGRAAARGDIDNDGKVDVLLVPNTGPARLLRNISSDHNHWIGLTLRGAPPNTDAYGAQVTIAAGSVSHAASLSSGSSYLSANDRRVHFGLGASASSVNVTVRWPNGRSEKFGPLPADRYSDIFEGKGAPAR